MFLGRLKFFYTATLETRLKIENGYNDYETVTEGVPQSLLLGHLGFNMHLIDFFSRDHIHVLEKTARSLSQVL